ncbi:hypothetical protein Q5X61_10650 [Acinetobacter baumannii]|nr:hypothetical protein [Acinetobacter baumannii]
MKNYQVWLEGYGVTGQQQGAQFIGEIEAETFNQAIENLLKQKEWNMSYLNLTNQTYWGSRFFDNEADARKAFG